MSDSLKIPRDTDLLLIQNNWTERKKKRWDEQVGREEDA